MRQVEMAELMIASNNFTASYAKRLYAATPRDQLVGGRRDKGLPGLSPDDVTRMESEIGKLGRDSKLIEESYRRNVLDVLA